ncbi:MAG TPA: hypothetical protein VNM92_16080 [Thermoanaerobaculia bacterium]|nr:hypothetical protein [Thermoanaerobaculia bacterium]
MSIRHFHIIFISAAVLLSVYCAVWGLRSYLAVGRTGDLVLGLVFIISGIGLAEYGRRAYFKLRELP